jgi:hypothetical protein
MRILTLIPAYGRDYKSAKAVLADWNDNKDFIINDFKLSGYVNKQQLEKLKFDDIIQLNFHYAKQTKVTAINL